MLFAHNKKFLEAFPGFHIHGMIQVIKNNIDLRTFKAIHQIQGFGQ